MSVKERETLVIPVDTWMRSISFTLRKATVNISTRTSDSLWVKVIRIVTGPGPLTGFGYINTPFPPTGVAVPVEMDVAVAEAVGVFVGVPVGVLVGVSV